VDSSSDEVKIRALKKAYNRGGHELVLALGENYNRGIIKSIQSPSLKQVLGDVRRQQKLVPLINILNTTAQILLNVLLSTNTRKQENL
jgi:hypothetical protein